MRHIPVLAREVLENLDPQSGQNIIDGTIGDGGHAELILEKIDEGRLLGLDQDPESLKRAKKYLGNAKNIILKQGNFRELKSLIPEDFGEVH
ncbi:MAG: 16S rRNA (cytosine(1402)-N(4))-methyltransferase, partial [Parcubacteria group bacterium]|nr:16S rRNA (cytosine(1402)-N(4))-methyltransferase [Parcubacteria group bacterium]